MTKQTPELDRLLALLRAQQSLLDDLERAAAPLSPADDPDTIAQAIDLRRDLVDRLTANAPDVDRAYCAWLGTRAPGDDDQVHALANDVAARLVRVEAANEQQAALLLARRDDLGERLRAVATGGRAGRAYAEPGQGSPRYQDTEA
ncbi:MAG: hypothetical protein SFY69_00680 [Planctomycetota bacterium]|nr:hypothetical protein [Planctomycetota bacterium]